MQSENNKRCSRCILDTTIEDIWFDENGVCKYCKIHNELEKTHPLGNKGKQRLNKIAEKIDNARLEVIKYSCHYPFFENPKEFNKIMFDFIDPEYEN